MHRRLFPEANFMLGRMDIHINITGRHRKKENRNRIATPLEETSIGLKNRMMENLVANESPIDESIQMGGG